MLARHEQNAGFAADGYRARHRPPAAAFVISGPGLTNILTALCQAYFSSVPVLVHRQQPDPRSSLGRHWGVLHELTDQRHRRAGVTAFAGSARTAEDLREQLRPGIRGLRAPRPRAGVPRGYPARPADGADRAAGGAFRRPATAGVEQRALVARRRSFCQKPSAAHHLPAAAPAAPAPRSATLVEAPGRLSHHDGGRQGAGAPKAIPPTSARACRTGRRRQSRRQADVINRRRRHGALETDAVHERRACRCAAQLVRTTWIDAQARTTSTTPPA